MDPPLPDRMEQNARVEAKVSGVSKGIRRTLDFAPGTGVTITGVDSATGEKVTITIGADFAATATALAGNGLDASGTTLVVDPSEFSAGMAGAGLTDTAGVLAVGEGHGIDVAADAVAVDETELDGSLIPGAGGWVRLGQITIGATASIFTFSSIPATYKNLFVMMQGRGNAAVTTGGLLLRINSDAAANYDREYVGGVGTTASANTNAATTFIDM